MSLLVNAAANTVLIAVAAALLRVSNLIVTSIFSGALSASDFGSLGLTLQTVGSLSTFTVLGLGTTATRFTAQARRSGPGGGGSEVSILARQFRWMGLLTGAAGGGAVYLFSQEFLPETIASNEWRHTTVVLAACLFFTTLQSIYAGLLSGFEAFRSLSFINVVTCINSVVWALYLSQFGMPGSLIASLLAVMVPVVISEFELERLLRKDARASSGTKGTSLPLRSIAEFALPIFLASLLVTPISWLCTLILVNHSQSALPAGEIRILSQVQLVALFLQSAYAQAILPKFASMDREAGQVRAELRKSVFLSIALTVLPSILLWLLVEPVKSFYHIRDDSKQFELLVGLSLIGCAFMAITEPMGVLLVARGRVWDGFVLNLIRSTCQIAATFLMREQGTVGFVAAWAGSYLVHVLFVGMYTWRRLPASAVHFREPLAVPVAKIDPRK